ncbi:hypothetical protein BA766_19370 [Stenotrophomonas maltophilia]|uniref:hypothetical protein n=1 Tax=Stenotrophomonas maltophilia TaxID=40324 RepID=UPI000810610A|nr:hypothetical protein [Stenotrophomonas maltophilia]OCK45317.1 hypothetical protein BA766_19370 [Stenotrophomonas maltophilia]
MAGDDPLLVDANLGWHECKAPTKVGDYRINGPAMARRINDLSIGLLLVGANLGWHECKAPTKVGDYRINGPAMARRINDLSVGLLLVGANLGWHNPSAFMTPATACQPRLAATGSMARR